MRTTRVELSMTSLLLDLITIHNWLCDYSACFLWAQWSSSVVCVGFVMATSNCLSTTVTQTASCHSSTMSIFRLMALLWVCACVRRRSSGLTILRKSSPSSQKADGDILHYHRPAPDSEIVTPVTQSLSNVTSLHDSLLSVSVLYLSLFLHPSFSLSPPHSISLPLTHTRTLSRTHTPLQMEFN